jgi:hypothetical protein
MSLLIAMGLFISVVVVLGIWAERRWKSIDSYHERESEDPPIFDAGDYLGGGRW